MHVAQHCCSDAELLLVAAYEGVCWLSARSVLRTNRTSVLEESATSLVGLYDATGRPEKAEEWKKLLAGTAEAAPPAKPQPE